MLPLKGRLFMKTVAPQLLTPGRVAALLGVPLHRVQHVLRTRDHITPIARAGNVRLYDRAALARIRHELTAIDARRGGQGVHDAS